LYFSNANGVSRGIYPTTSFVETGVTSGERGRVTAVITLLGHSVSAQITASYPSVSCRQTGVSLFTSPLSLPITLCRLRCNPNTPLIARPFSRSHGGGARRLVLSDKARSSLSSQLFNCQGSNSFSPHYKGHLQGVFTPSVKTFLTIKDNYIPFSNPRKKIYLLIFVVHKKALQLTGQKGIGCVRIFGRKKPCFSFKNSLQPPFLLVEA